MITNGGPHSQIFTDKFKNHVMWSGQGCSVIFTMLGSVQGCHIIELTTLSQHVCKAITIVPYGEVGVNSRDSWEYFMAMVRWEDLLSMGACWPSLVDTMVLTFLVCCPFHQYIASCVYIVPESRQLWCVDSCHSQKEWGLSAALVLPHLQSGTTRSSKIVSIFDKASTLFCYQTVLAMLIMRLYFQFLCTMFQKRLSALTEIPLLGCLPFPCTTRDLVRLLTCWLSGIGFFCHVLLHQEDTRNFLNFSNEWCFF